MGFTHSDHRQPGSIVERVTVVVPTVTTSTRPLGNSRMSVAVSTLLLSAMTAPPIVRSGGHGARPTPNDREGPRLRLALGTLQANRRSGRTADDGLTLGPVEFRILGPVEVMHDGQTVAPGSPKQRALLVNLIVHHGKVVSRDRLIEDLWAGSPPSTGLGVLQNYISQLRKVLGATVVVTRGT